MKLLPLIFAILVLVALASVWLVNSHQDEPQAPAPAPAPVPVAPKPSHTPPEPIYTTGPASRDGIGKFYLGREISFVMGHRAINWLERGNREAQEAPSRAVAELDLAPDAVIADIGAGSGYYTFRLAPLVPDGKVVAVDIQPEMIAYLEARRKKRGITNIEAHLGTIEDTKLPPSSIDAALLVDAYHEFSHPYEMMRSIVRALRPGGRVFLIEFRAEDPEVNIKPLHKMTQVQAKKEMTAVGLRWVRTGDFLPQQHFMVFEKP